MPGSWTTPGHMGTRAAAPMRIAFHQFDGVGTRKKITFAAQWLAYALPCRRFARTLAGTGARLGADAVRSGRTMARTGLRMMPTSPSSPLSAARRVFPVTAGRLACQAGLAQCVSQLKPAPGIHSPTPGLSSPFVHLMADIDYPVLSRAVG